MHRRGDVCCSCSCFSLSSFHLTSCASLPPLLFHCMFLFFFCFPYRGFVSTYERVLLLFFLYFIYFVLYSRYNFYLFPLLIIEFSSFSLFFIFPSFSTIFLCFVLLQIPFLNFLLLFVFVSLPYDILFHPFYIQSLWSFTSFYSTFYCRV